VTVFIDRPNAPGHGRLWSHLVSDTSFDELHRFAAGLGIPRRGFDRDHYDIPAERYSAVVAAGAVPVSGRELLAVLARSGLRRRKRETPGVRRPGAALARSPRLRRGDSVAVVAPAGPVDGVRLDVGLSVLASWGLDARESAHVRGRDERLSYLAADDETRAADLMTAWCDPDVAAVFCARGGYGVARLLGLLDWDALTAAGPKVLVGFSDVTALHQAFAARLGVASVHGPVVTSLGAGDEDSREHLRRLLFEPAGGASSTAGVSVTGEPGTGHGGRAEGVVVGGNLAVLAALAGTPYSRPAAGSLVLLEDVGEEPYRLDRLLTQLLLAGWFAGVRGIAVGRFTGCGDEDDVRTVLEDRLLPLGVPVVWNLPVGHVPRNLAVPLGVAAVLEADEGTLTLREPAVL
jgi:muramoyltetrapeptide carboxypeptidase